MVSYFNRPPRPGSTDEAAQKFLRMLEREEREKLERARLEAANWQAPASSTTPFSAERIFGDGRDAVADRVQAELDRRDALRDAARRRAALDRPSDQSFARMPGATYSGQLAEANEQNARPSSGPGVGRTPQQPPTTPSMLPPNQQQFELWLRDDPSLLDQATRLERLRALGQQPWLPENLKELGSKLAAGLEVPTSLLDVDKPLEQQFFDAVLKDPVITEAAKNWPKLKQPKSFAREEILKRIIEHHVRIYGYAMPNIRFGTNDIGSGHFDWDKNELAIDPLEGGFGLPRSVFGTTAHEATHAYHDALADALTAGRIHPSDPRYPLAEIMRYNEKFYTPLRDDKGHYNPVDYAREPLEKEAEALANRLREALRAKWLSESGSR